MKMKNEPRIKKAIDVCYQGKKPKMNLDVGFRS
jgi:hypothetical protein